MARTRSNQTTLTRPPTTLSVVDRRAFCERTATNIQQYGLVAGREMLASDVFVSGYDLSTQYVDALFRDARAMHERKLALFRQKLEEAMTKQYEEAARVRKVKNAKRNAKNAKRNAKKRAARRRIELNGLKQQAADIRQAVAQKAKKGDQHTPVGREEMEAMEAKAAALMAQAAAMGAAAEA